MTAIAASLNHMNVDLALVDLDDRATWPDPIRAFSNEWASQLRGSTIYTSDLPGRLIEKEETVRSFFSKNKLLAFHATRLCDREVRAIRSEGLHCLSKQLVERKIENAYSCGALTFEQREHCLKRNVYAIDNQQYREDQICLVAGRSIFDDPESGPGLHPFLGGWGGEAIHGGPGPDEDPVLRSLGRPTIVAVRLDLAASDPKARASPPLASVFVGRVLGLSDAFASIHFHADIPGEDILAILQPGDPEYDRHLELPRS